MDWAEYLLAPSRSNVCNAEIIYKCVWVHETSNWVLWEAHLAAEKCIFEFWNVVIRRANELNGVRLSSNTERLPYSLRQSKLMCTRHAKWWICLACTAHTNYAHEMCTYAIYRFRRVGLACTHSFCLSLSRPAAGGAWISAVVSDWVPSTTFEIKWKWVKSTQII